MTDKLDKPWYNHLIDECRSIIVEKTFESRWTLIEGYHELGTRILQDYDNFEREKIYGEQILRSIAISLKMPERMLYYAVQFARTYPDVGQVPGGKNISWTKICREVLPAKKDNKSHDEARQTRVSAPPSSLPSLPGLSEYKTYLEYVESRPCIVCGKSPVDKAHFPKTRGAGADENWVVPLCRECHSESHQGPKDWMWARKNEWAAYMYGLILKIWDKT